LKGRRAKRERAARGFRRDSAFPRHLDEEVEKDFVGNDGGRSGSSNAAVCRRSSPIKKFPVGFG
jgi:hypothetical protein